MTKEFLRILTIAAAEARRHWVSGARYKIEFVGMLTTLYGTFFLLHFIGRHVSLPMFAFGVNVRAESLAYSLWAWSYAIVGAVQSQTLAELGTGAIEPLLVASGSARRLMLGRTLGFAAQSLATCGGLVATVYTCWPGDGSSTHWIGVACAVLVALMTSAGFAAVVAGLVMLFKRVSIVMLPVSILMLWALMSPGAPPRAGWAALAPYLACRGLLIDAAGGRFDPVLFARGAVGATVVLFAGLLLLAGLERRARHLGRLSMA